MSLREYYRRLRREGCNRRMSVLGVVVCKLVENDMRMIDEMDHVE